MAKGIVGKIIEHEGVAMEIDLRDDLTTEQVASIMVAVSDYCEQRGWHPGRVARAYSDLKMRQMGGIPWNPEQN